MRKLLKQAGGGKGDKPAGSCPEAGLGSGAIASGACAAGRGGKFRFSIAKDL